MGCLVSRQPPQDEEAEVDSGGDDDKDQEGESRSVFSEVHLTDYSTFMLLPACQHR